MHTITLKSDSLRFNQITFILFILLSEVFESLKLNFKIRNPLELMIYIDYRVFIRTDMVDYITIITNRLYVHIILYRICNKS